MNFLNIIILKLIPLLPKSIVYQVAGKYVAGVSEEDALSTVRALNNEGYSATLDILGEHTDSKDKVDIITNQYVHLYHKIHAEKLDCNISVKPTHIGLDISVNEFEANLNILIQSAEQTGNFLRIDMESSCVTDQTIISTLKVQNTFDGIGTVLQAYLYRTMDDIDTLNQHKSQNIRLCKGIYKEPETIAIQSRKKINDNYIRLLKKLIEKDCYVCVATHDQELLEIVYRVLEDNKVDPARFEFQVLFGVPMGNWMEKHFENNYKVRVYVPFGADWYDYSIRRLRENPGIAGYVLKNFFKR